MVIDARCILLAALAQLALGAGCAPSGGSVRLEDAVIDFGASMPGGGVERELRVVADGGGSAEIERVEVAGEGFLEGAGEAGDPLARKVYFHPPRSGLFAGEARVTVRLGDERAVLRADLRGASSEESECGAEPCAAPLCTPPVSGTCSWSESEGNRCTLPAQPCAWLTWAPEVLDFGYATPGFEARRTLTFFNHRADPITLTQLSYGSPELSVVLADGTTPPTLEVPGARRNPDGVWIPGALPLALVTKATTLGPRQAQLGFTAVLRSGADVALATSTILIRLWGGGPEIAVRPNPMTFGKVAWFEGNTTALRQDLEVMNVGTVPGNAEGNLRLGRFDQSGAWIPGSFATVTPLNAQTSTDEISVELPASYQPGVGVVATLGANTLRLPVTLAPSSTGLKETRITIHSNDADEPDLKVKVSAEVVVLPACDWSVSPAAIDFGEIAPGGYRDASFTLQNLGTAADAACLVYAVELTGSDGAAFSLPSGSTERSEIAPGGERLFNVRAWGRAAGDGGTAGDLATITVSLSSSTRPRATVSLRVGP